MTLHILSRQYRIRVVYPYLNLNAHLLITSKLRAPVRETVALSRGDGDDNKAAAAAGAGAVAAGADADADVVVFGNNNDSDGDHSLCF